MTSGVKVGQKVRVTYEGVVGAIDQGTRYMSITDSDNEVTWHAIAPSAVVEVLPEPLKIGDEITWEAQEPPLGARLVNQHGTVAMRFMDGWYVVRWTDLTGPHTWVWLNNNFTPSWRVVWLPGNQT